MQRAPTPQEARFVNVSLAQGYSAESVAVHLEIKGWGRSEAAAYIESTRREVARQGVAKGQSRHTTRSFQVTLGATMIGMGVMLLVGTFVLLDQRSGGTYAICLTPIAAGTLRLLV